MLVLPVNAFKILNGLNTADCVRQSVRGMILKERVVLKRKIVYRNDWRFEIISGSRHKKRQSLGPVSRKSRELSGPEVITNFKYES